MSENNHQKILKVWKDQNLVNNPASEKTILQVLNHVSSFFAPGKYYFYIFNFFEGKFDYVSPSVKEVLGVSADEFDLNYFLGSLHQDDVTGMEKKEMAAIDFLFNKIKAEDIDKYKVVYSLKVKHKTAHYITLLHQARAIIVSKDKKIQKVLGVHTDIGHVSSNSNNKISFIGEGVPSYMNIDITSDKSELNELNYVVSNSELKIIKLLSKGYSAKQIAGKLGISAHTVNTHKKTILAKTGAKNTTELVANCIRQGMIV